MSPAGIEPRGIRHSAAPAVPAMHMTALRRYHGAMQLSFLPAKGLGALAASIAAFAALASLTYSAFVLAQAGAADHQPLLRALNNTRQQGCNGQTGPRTVLHHNARLSEAAARIADGSSIEDALKASDYRAVKAAQIMVKGYKDAAGQARGAVGNFCDVFMRGDLSDAGFYQQGTQTWIVVAAPFLPPGAGQADDVEEHVLALVNMARATPRRCGKEYFAAAGPLRADAELQRAALAHAQDMARHSYFSHTGRDGSGAAQRATRAGYRWRMVGENIAAGQMQADAAMQSWLKSPGHCANIMRPEFAEMGVAFSVNNQSTLGIYWVQLFGKPR
ncbi:MAG TPA: CAP domain-containing protein [Polaromonas sp.]|uniref:CAP domain-containing protein n=1 Tax=Polaromonas sp. TaxID=1869339 RepID=UPI002D588D44|nr:CAP domain-containing protein [Polaromonas sp.]HYW55395.1 CAP domain-containing protein [Polaromonas sp.]